ncbi:MAG: hypothetical protein KDA91_12575 [Planctomycetaceae bacterium]|nr:hypothetical protein [Planctomycetaceae bacterium]
MSDPFAPPVDNSLSLQRTWKLKRVGILSCGIFGATAGAAFGLVAAGLFLMVVVFAALVAPANSSEVMPVVGAGIGLMFGAPIGYGLLGFLGGILNAFVYNTVANLSGGIEVEFGD